MRFLHSRIAASSIVQSQNNRILNSTRRRTGHTVSRQDERYDDMAMMTETRNAVGHPGLFSRLVTGLAERYQRHRTYRSCVAELSALSDRELRDLGLHRSMIRSLAHEEAYGSM